MKKRWLSLLLVLVLCMPALSGCALSLWSHVPGLWLVDVAEGYITAGLWRGLRAGYDAICGRCAAGHRYDNTWTCTDCGDRKIPSEGLSYLLSSSGGKLECRIMGIGTCTDTDIVIPTECEGVEVVSINSAAFKGCNITSVAVPPSVRSIGDQAFWNCTGLRRVELFDGLRSIGYSAFADCTSLTTVSLPASLTSLDGSAFADSPHVTETEGGITYVDRWALGFDKTKTAVTLRADTVGMANGLFQWAMELERVALSNKLTSIPSNAFYGCYKLKELTLPDSVTAIGQDAFRHCRALTKLNIPDGVNSIGQDAFLECDGIIEQETGVFYVGRWAIDCDWEKADAVVLRADTVGIGAAAFSGCVSLPAITLPATLRAIGDDAFSVCVQLAHINIPDGVTVIGDRAFQTCTALTQIEIPQNVTKIGKEAFWMCHFLEQVTLPAALTYIGPNAFLDCPALARVTFAKAEGWTADGTPIPAARLGDPAMAAELLTEEYKESVWQRG